MSIVNRGTIALVGAGEYLPKMNPVDQYLLEQLQETPSVVVLPTASAPDGAGVSERWNNLGVEHFTQLGAPVEPLMRRSDRRVFCWCDGDGRDPLRLPEDLEHHPRA